ncbi:MAG: aminotransferase class III-fold pyridoxal phosphate-dependent enzyme [Deltaproteobacteria bacterium]|nr:aminotransferase class III-fold pyridoxal phosphate-dependent enzyme [Deltaproteobacteria bacterium]
MPIDGSSDGLAESVAQHIGALHRIRDWSGPRSTTGLSDATVGAFLCSDPSLGEAIERAVGLHLDLRRRSPELVTKPEADLRRLVQTDYLSFYGKDAASPYLPLAASGPWIVTTHGAVLHDSGGYGMLGLGHAPPQVLDAMSQPLAMANVMTPSLSQRRFAKLLEAEIGHTRGGCPFSRFICLNSGSEAVTMASRICDLGAYSQTISGARHHGKQIKQLSLEGGFHGRTDRAARLSHSTKAIYEANLASFRDQDLLDVVPPNDLAALEAVFARVEAQGIFYEAMFIEPVMGEGVPGMGITPEFYALARKLTRDAGTLLVVDSIQAALRAHGVLSIVDYPGFEACDAPDMETYSKALNAGQYPLSVLALTAEAASLYVTGVYGNTMTTNPRALEVGCAVLRSMTDELRQNIRARGTELKHELEQLAVELAGAIRSVTGTGLMVCAELDPRSHQVTGLGGVEEQLRKRGISMIHGGENGLRFTPHFAITSTEVDLIVDSVRAVLADAS